MKLGDIVHYWVNYRGNGSVGGWQRHYYAGRVLWINRKTIQLQRIVARTAYGVETVSRVETVPKERISEETP